MAMSQKNQKEQPVLQTLSVIDDGMIPGAIDIVEETGIPSADFEPSWRRQPSLMAPPPREGYVQKWIRMVDVDGNPDTRNIEESVRREGWRPRFISTVPAKDNRGYPTQKWSDKGDAIYVGGMCLMERPIALEESMRRMLKAETDRRTSAIWGNQIDEKDRRYAGTSYEQERVTSVGGRVAPVDD